MQRLLMTLTLLAGLAGCAATEGLLQRDPTLDQYYTLDTERLRLCRGSSSLCHDLTLIVSNRQYAPQFERTYGTRLSGPNYPVNLAQMLAEPPGAQYPVRAMDDIGRIYQLPVNEQTNSVWNALEQATDKLFE